MLAVVSEVLSHGAARVGGQVLQGGGVGGGGRDHDGVLHGVGVSQPLHQLGHGGSLLADGHVDAVELLLLVGALVETLLVDDCVDGNGGFAGAGQVVVMARDRTQPLCLFRRLLKQPFGQDGRGRDKNRANVSLPSLSVSDDQLTLASSNGHQTVHSLDASLHGLPDGDTRDDSRGFQTNAPAGFGTQGTLT